jgi:hypothetical protein
LVVGAPNAQGPEATRQAPGPAVLNRHPTGSSAPSLALEVQKGIAFRARAPVPNGAVRRPERTTSKCARNGAARPTPWRNHRRFPHSAGNRPSASAPAGVRNSDSTGSPIFAPGKRNSSVATTGTSPSTRDQLLALSSQGAPAALKRSLRRPPLRTAAYTRAPSSGGDSGFAAHIHQRRNSRPRWSTGLHFAIAPGPQTPRRCGRRADGCHSRRTAARRAGADCGWTKLRPWSFIRPVRAEARCWHGQGNKRRISLGVVAHRAVAFATRCTIWVSRKAWCSPADSCWPPERHTPCEPPPECRTGGPRGTACSSWCHSGCEFSSS